MLFPYGKLMLNTATMRRHEIVSVHILRQPLKQQHSPDEAPPNQEGVHEVL